MSQQDENPVDCEVLAAVFASRVALAKKTEEQAVEDARREHRATLLWIGSGSQKERSFLWYCDEFELDAGAVRRAIRERK